MKDPVIKYLSVVTADELDRAVTMAPERVTAHKTVDYIRETS